MRFAQAAWVRKIDLSAKTQGDRQLGFESSLELRIGSGKMR
jgi:hypothetical protein